jgi:hypothetical protein
VHFQSNQGQPQDGYLRIAQDWPTWHNQEHFRTEYFRTEDLQCRCSEVKYWATSSIGWSVDFTMLNQGKTVRCAISTAAMDNLEGKHDVKADQRINQFVRLRDAIEERASRKFFEGPVEAEGPVVLRSNDFFK